MANRAGLQTGVSTTFALTPGMRLGLDLLRMGPLELIDRLHEEAEANPLLLVADSGSQRPTGHRLGQSSDALVQPVSLSGHVMSQIGTMGLPPDVRVVAQYLCGNLDDRGYLGISRAEAAVDLRCDPETIDIAIEALRSCDPAGVGARSLRDCLALQLHRTGLPEERAYRIVGALEPLMAADWPTAQAILGGTEAELAAVAALVRGLDPEPGLRFAPGVVPVLLPDLRVEPGRNGSLIVTLHDAWMPRVQIDTELGAHGLRDTSGRAVTEAQLQAAQTLLRAIEFRGTTMKRVGLAIVAAQRSFFLGRSAFPQPLARQEIAARLTLHPSTVGRAVRGRSLEFAGRVLPLDWFFPAPVGTTSLPISQLKHHIAHLIGAETGDRAMSDEQIAKLLQESGVDITRRSVAKYRKCMSIPSSHIRTRSARRR